MKHSKFELGNVVATTAVAYRMERDKPFNNFVQHCLNRHMSGDWGDLCRSDIKMNDEALRDGLRILSVYKSKRLGTTIWIITEADRSHTTVLYPEEY